MNPSTENQPSITQKQTGKNTWRRILALFTIFIYALVGWLRCREAFIYWNHFIDLDVWPRPLYFVLSGIGVGLAFSLALVFVLFKTTFAHVYLRITGCMFLAWFWFDRIWLIMREAFFDQLEISVLVSLATLFIIFVLVRKKDYQKEKTHDGK